MTTENSGGGSTKQDLRRNRRYVGRLVKAHSESGIRAMLTELSLLDQPECCQRLRLLDLDSGPLEEIIHPYDPFGLSFEVERVSEKRIKVNVGEAHDLVGSGANLLLEPRADGSYHVVEMLSEWIS